jgi:ATP-dependent helicase/nuclease subunit A
LDEETGPPAAAPHSPSDPLGQRFRRGRLIHALLQSLPNLPGAARAAAAERFLARPGHGLDAAGQQAIAAEVMALLDDPDFAEAFGPTSLAEAPVAGRIAGQLLVGQVDRLCVSDTRVLVIDYKTNRPPPGAAGDVSAGYLRQMAAYRALLRLAFPGRVVQCALLWTYSARLMPLEDALLDIHQPSAS